MMSQQVNSTASTTTTTANAGETKVIRTDAPVVAVETKIYTAEPTIVSSTNMETNTDGNTTIYLSNTNSTATVKDMAMGKVESVKQTVTSKVEGAKAIVQEKWEEEKAKVNNAVELGKEKVLGVLPASLTASNSTTAAATTTTTTSDQSALEKVKVQAQALQEKGQHLAESAQVTLDLAKEKAREVLVGAQHKAEEMSLAKDKEVKVYIGKGPLPTAETAQVRIQTDTSLPNGIESVKVDAKGN